MQFSGRLTAGLGSPLARMPVQIVERFAPGAQPAERVTTVQTGGDGAFSAHLEPGPSRDVAAVFAGTRTLTRSGAKPQRLGVRTGVRMRASSPSRDDRRAADRLPRPGRSGRSGDPARRQVGAAPVPARRAFPGPSSARSRPTPSAASSYAYRFSDNDSRGVRFQFRAVAPTQSDWPYEPEARGQSRCAGADAEGQRRAESCSVTWSTRS